MMTPFFRSRQIDARLNAEHHTLFKGRLAATDREARRLVDFQPDAVPQAVREVVAVPHLRQVVAGQGVSILAGHPLADAALGRLLGRQHQLVDLAELVAGRADADGPRHVRAVAVDVCPDVDGDRLALLELAIRGDSVRH
jgi:hypothetical protein